MSGAEPGRNGGGLNDSLAGWSRWPGRRRRPGADQGPRRDHGPCRGDGPPPGHADLRNGYCHVAPPSVNVVAAAPGTMTPEPKCPRRYGTRSPFPDAALYEPFSPLTARGRSRVRQARFAPWRLWPGLDVVDDHAGPRPDAGVGAARVPQAQIVDTITSRSRGSG